MDPSNQGSSYGSEKGARRRKLAGYLKAANELRQSYAQAYGFGSSNGDGSDEANGAGSPGDVSVVQRGDDEMVLFPSYAKRHQAKKGRHEIPGLTEDLQNSKLNASAEPGKTEWDRYEAENAVVEVDVRGWLYAPSRGQMTRRNRILIGIARRLSGIPAPSGNSEPNPASARRTASESSNKDAEEAVVEKEARSIAMRAQGEAEAASRGALSEGTDTPSDRLSIHCSPGTSRATSPDPMKAKKSLSNNLRTATGDSMQRRETWNQPADMSPEELATANAHLMSRLKPFLTTPLSSMQITVFFYNEQVSQARSTWTNESGHFNLRVALDFVPTNVRVLASDKLSAAQEVHIIEPKGVSLISDIDDTIKHSGIGSGAREIFRNAFIRDLGDLMITGVKEWYNTLADMGVKMHYVSNSPWQVYPALTSFFAMAGLPKGSFHLKQYSGMLQGIFEPVAERKRGTIERIMSDFPDRKFVLVGDSGEADLELYTDTLLENPGRILAVFIRDVTSTRPLSVLDAAPRSRGSGSPRRRRPGGSRGSSPRLAAVQDDQAPPLPQRRVRSSNSLNLDHLDSHSPPEPPMGKLIDFDDDNEAPQISQSPPSMAVDGASSSTNPAKKAVPPPRPDKPLALRPESSRTHSSPSTLLSKRKSVPPPPPPRRNANPISTSPKEPSPLSQSQTPPRPAIEPQTSYRAAVLNKVASVYNALPTLTSSNDAPPPPPPPRRPGPTGSSGTLPNAATAAAAAASRILGAQQSPGTTSPDGLEEQQLVLSKKEEMWLRRWDTARTVFEEKGVPLRAWREGSDVAAECVGIVERELKSSSSSKS